MRATAKQRVDRTVHACERRRAGGKTNGATKELVKRKYERTQTRNLLLALRLRCRKIEARWSRYRVAAKNRKCRS